jgi:hypothetical protein
MHIPISERISQELLSSLEDVFASADDVEVEDLYLSSSVRDGVPPPEDRVYLSQDNFVLRTIREALVDVDRRGIGARVFLTPTRAYCLDDDEELTLVTWDWPGEDLEEGVAAVAEKM